MKLGRVATCLAVTAAFALSAAAQTVDQIIAKNIAARGGEAKVRALKSVRLSGTIEVGPGMTAPITTVIKRPGMVRMDITVQGMAAVQAYDGKMGWSLLPFQGKKDPDPMSPDDTKRMEDQTDLDGPLVDYQAKGNTVEFLGTDKVEGSDAYKLKVTKRSGAVETDFIDVESGFKVKTITKALVQGRDAEVEVAYGDFRTVDGLTFAFSIEQSVIGTPQKQKITVEKIEVNPALDDSLFRMPAPAPAEPPKPADKPGPALH